MERIDQWIEAVKKQKCKNKKKINRTQGDNDKKMKAIGNLKADYSQILSSEIPPLG